MPSTPLRIGRAVVLGAALLLLVPFGLYILAANTLLNTGLGRRVMNCRPEIVQIRFERAWTLWPGRFHVRNFDVSGQDARAQFEVTAVEGTVTFSPFGLGREMINGSRVRGHGFTIRVRMRVPVLPSPAVLAQLPPIRGFGPPLTDDVPERTIGVRLEDIDVHGIHEVWIDGIRFTGDIDLQGGFLIKPETRLRVDGARLEVRAGDASIGGVPALADLRGRIDARLDEINYGAATRQDLSALSAAVTLDARLVDLAFTASLLGARPPVALDDGGGPLAMQVHIDHGVVAAGSAFDFTTERASLRRPPLRLDTGLSLHAAVDDAHPGVTVAVELDDLDLSTGPRAVTLAHAEAVHLRGQTSGRRLAEPQEVVAHLEVPHAVAHDLRVVNSYLPTGLHIDRGAAALSLQADLDGAARRVEATADLEAEDLSVRQGGAQLLGRVRVHAALNRLDLDSQAADLSGSRVALEDVTVRVGGHETRGWWARVRLPRCSLRPHGARRLEGEARVRLKNLQPVVRVIATSVSIPGIVKALSDREDVDLQATVALGQDTLAATGLRLDSADLAVAGHVAASHLDSAHPRIDGAIRLRLRRIVIGLAIEDSGIKPILAGVDSWFAGTGVR